MTQRTLLRLLTCVVTLLVVTSGASADSLTGKLSPRVVTPGGELIEARTGTYGDLFPGASQLPAGQSVLALDIQPQEGAGGRLLVPGTGDERLESSPIAIFEPAEDLSDETLLLIWQSIGAEGTSRRVHFTSVRRGSNGLVWSDVFVVRDAAGEPLELTEAPRFAITRQDFSHQLGEETLQANHTLMHLLWQDGGATATPMYTSLVWVDGLYVGFNPVFDLAADFLAGSSENDDSAPPTAPEDLLATAHLAVGAEGRSLQVTFAAVEAGRIGSLVINAVPLSYAVLGDLVRDEFFSNAESFDPGQLQTFVDKFRADVVIIGRNFKYHPAVIEYVSSRVGHWILDQGTEYGYEAFAEMGEDARDMTIDLTHSVYASTVENPAIPGSTLVEIDLSDVLGGGTTAAHPGQLLDFKVAADLVVPPQAANDVALLPSADGEQVVVTWLDAETQRLFYTESQLDGSWSTTKSLQLRQGLSREEAEYLLVAKLR